MTRLFIVRHGETDYNREKRIAGQLDVPLNELGRAQARATAELLKDESIAAVYASDLLRAAETAQFIAAKHKLDVISFKELRERSYGHWEGKLSEEIERLFPEEYEQLRQAPLDFVPPGGESRKELYERVTKKLNEILAGHSAESVVIVSHGGPIRAMINYVIAQELGIPVPQQSQVRIDADLCSVSLLSHDEKEGLRIILLNSTYHLKGL